MIYKNTIKVSLTSVNHTLNDIAIDKTISGTQHKTARVNFQPYMKEVVTLIKKENIRLRKIDNFSAIPSLSLSRSLEIIQLV